MSVKKLLATQSAGYISLNEVLTRLTQIDGATYQEAATLLHRLLSEEDASRPEWYWCDNLQGKRKTSALQENDAWECLRQAAQSGSPATWNDDEIIF